MKKALPPKLHRTRGILPDWLGGVALCAVFVLGLIPVWEVTVLAQGVQSGLGLAGQAAFGALTQSAAQVMDDPERSSDDSAATSPESIGKVIAVAPSTVWNLTGTVTARGLGGSQSTPVTATLTLYPDRTYQMSVVGEPVIETGVWFESRKGILLFQQNILAQLVALEADVANEVGEPVVISITRIRGRVRSTKKQMGYP